MNRVLLGLVLALIVLLAVPATAANIVQNGSFENPQTTLWPIAPPGDPLGRVGWTVFGSTVYLINGATNGYYVSSGYDGAQVMQLSRDSWIGQTLPTVPGQLYKVTFAMTGAVNVPEAAHRMLVVWQSVYEGNYTNNYLQDITFAAGQGNTPANPIWNTFEFTVAAGQGVNTINFGGVDMYPWVDAVTVEAVPEPASFVVLLTGLVGAVAWRRGRK